MTTETDLLNHTGIDAFAAMLRAELQEIRDTMARERSEHLDLQEQLFSEKRRAEIGVSELAAAHARIKQLEEVLAIEQKQAGLWGDTADAQARELVEAETSIQKLIAERDEALNAAQLCDESRRRDNIEKYKQLKELEAANAELQKEILECSKRSTRPKGQKIPASKKKASAKRTTPATAKAKTSKRKATVR